MTDRVILLQLSAHLVADAGSLMEVRKVSQLLEYEFRKVPSGQLHRQRSPSVISH